MELSTQLELHLRELSADPALWREQAFCEPVLGWEARYPDLARQLRTMDETLCAALSDDPDAAAVWLRTRFPQLPWPITQEFELPEVSPRAEPVVHLLRDIPGRKVGQIRAFSARVDHGAGRLVEWCAGKAHLGRWLALTGGVSEVRALEHDPALCAEAMRLGKMAGQPIDAVCCDVLSPSAADLLVGADQVLALHACGELHLRLMEASVEARVDSLAFAPCCYHLSPRQPWQGMTSEMQRYHLSLTAQDLRTAVQETVTAPLHVRRHREQVQAWQLGWDLLRRSQSGRDRWQPIPRVRAAGDFRAYCLALADRTGLRLGSFSAFEQFEVLGRHRALTVRALDLVRHQFRRPLERLLVLDRALWLSRQGYDVNVSLFCSRSITPRNILISARRSPRVAV